MRLVRVNSLRDDMELARDIPSPVLGAQPLLRRGVTLTQALGARLASLGVRAVWIEDDLGDGIVPAQPLPEHIRRSTERAVSRCLDQARSVAADLTSLPATVLGTLEQAAADIMAALAECPEAVLAFDDLASADSYTYSHSVRVATLGLLLGQRIDRIECRSREILRELGSLEGESVDEADLRAVLAQFEPMWGFLNAREQARIIRTLIQYVDYSGKTDTLTVRFR